MKNNYQFLTYDTLHLEPHRMTGTVCPFFIPHKETGTV